MSSWDGRSIESGISPRQRLLQHLEPSLLSFLRGSRPAVTRVNSWLTSISVQTEHRTGTASVGSPSLNIHGRNLPQDRNSDSSNGQAIQYLPQYHSTSPALWIGKMEPAHEYRGEHPGIQKQMSTRRSPKNSNTLRRFIRYYNILTYSDWSTHKTPGTSTCKSQVM